MNHRIPQLTDKQVETYVIIVMMLMELYEHDTEKVASWLNTANSYFFGYTPIEYIVLGREESIVDLLKGRLGWA